MEHSFLGNVARSLYSQYGDRISSLNIVLPNRRSRLFLEHELAEVIDKPLWQPTYLSVDELMSQFADIRPADRIRSVVELYKVWQEYHDEPFDRFYFWGEMLLGDFDQIDKYMIDAGRLFRNINEIKEIGDEFEYLAEEQRAAVARFWAAFSTDKGVSAEKERFRTIWNSLWPVYCKFRERLAAQGVGYAGMIHRTAAESITSGSIGREDGGAYVVIGFNALSACEKVLFDHLKSVYNADFFWDYDDYYMDDPMQEAGLFAKDNIRRYPHPQYFRNKTDNFSARKNISAASLPSDSLQCKYAATFLGEVWERQGYVAQETAIVLTNEDLLVPLLYSLPDYVKDVNVTMGYPLRHSLAYSFTERLLKLQNHARKKNGEVSFYHGDVTGLLEHPFILSADREFAERLRTDIIMKSRIYVRGNEFAGSPFLQTIFSFQEKPVELIGYIIGILSSIAASGINHGANKYEAMMQREFFGEIAETLRKLANSLEGCGVEMTSATVSSLARRMLQNVRIPYSGEPLRGLQVMGILETRNLDFDNVLILSMTDDNFPGNPSAVSTFIPYNLRFAYGLPTPQHHDGVYAYYFYRLLQRASDIYFAYSSKTNEDSTGEPSRYIYQLEYESPHKVARRSVELDVNLSGNPAITVDKSAVVMDRMARLLDGAGGYVSPSAFNAYLDCPLKFYFRTVAGLKPDDGVNEEIDVAMFGNILHKAMEILYTPLKGISEPGKNIETLINTPGVDLAVDRAISAECFGGEPFADSDIGGNLLLVRDIVRRYINSNIFPFDARQQGFTIIELERSLTCDFGFDIDGTTHTIKFSGLADRVDLLEGGRLRIVDYKTGTPHQDFAGTEALMGSVPKERVAAVTQTLLYSLMADRMQRQGDLPGTSVCPALYYVRLMNDPDYSPLLNHKDAGSVEEYGEYAGKFEAQLALRLGELFDRSVPFSQCEDPAPCAYCDFDVICRRGQ